MMNDEPEQGSGLCRSSFLLHHSFIFFSQLIGWTWSGDGDMPERNDIIKK
jgi:hypothetical protein